MIRIGQKAGKLFDVLSQSEFEADRIEGEIIRNAHSIEKGLSLEHVKPGFGFAKMTAAFELIERYKEIRGNYESEAIGMFADAVKAYLEFHKELEYQDEHTRRIEKLYGELTTKGVLTDGTMGGYQKIKKTVYSEEELTTLRSLFENRHSVREFADTSVDKKKLEWAIELACHCPSACNRQCYRVHVLSRKNFDKMDGWLDGIGGFAEDVDQFLIVTAKLSVYRKSEEMQYVVSASVFAAYLTLALQALSIGCCFVQRPFMPNAGWSKVAAQLRIPRDEQVVCVLGIGNLKDEYKVPVSHRLSQDIIVNYIE